MVLPLVCSVQKYAWGMFGLESKVALLASSSFEATEKIDQNTPYAEASLLSKDPGHSLPFLLKCLSVRTALSIQAHPDKELAKKLRIENPAAYPDDQAKPEMTVAINGQFEAMVGFRPLSDLVEFSERIPLFASLVLGADPKEIYKSILERITSFSDSDLEKILKALMEFFTTQKDLLPPKAVFFKLSKEFPNDVGILYAFLLNHLVLEEGECIFLGANEPHAYLSGSCIELMTSSDNVVRAGLTPKFKDVPTLLSMLTYTSSGPSRFVVEKKSTAPGINLYQPPITDFALERISLLSSSLEVFCKSDSLLLITDGHGTVKDDLSGEEFHITAGSTFYLYPGSKLFISAIDELQGFRAFKP